MKRWWIAWFVCLPLLGQAQHVVVWSTNYYAVTGATLPEITRSMRQARPWKDRLPTDAMTEWTVNWQFQMQTTDAGAALHTFGTRTTIKITMPRWQVASNASPEVKAAWDTYFRALFGHELGHARNALAAPADMYREVWALGPQPDTATLEQRVTAICNNTIAARQKLDQDYDTKTDHGATEGARLGGGPGPGGRGTNAFPVPPGRRPRGGPPPR